ncbi:MAG TPA: hypothetical protein VGR69_05750 [Candidatus Rubrimentiphilum sp.]|nr:hypothetical protein [Candidatus Rubrimentiphilum sp.]
MRLLALGLFRFLLAPAPHTSRYLVVWGMETNVFPADRKGHDFLSVFDISDSRNFGTLIAMVPVATHSQMGTTPTTRCGRTACSSPTISWRRALIFLT